MSIPEPRPGLVFRYEYLWKSQSLAGRETAAKDRPACIVIATGHAESERRVLIVPITRSQPTADTVAIEIPVRLKLHLGLDNSRSWIILSEANIDCWPSPDMRSIPNHPGRFDYGLLPQALVNRIREAILTALKNKTLPLVERT